MKRTYQCGRIFVSGQYRDDVNYDVCSNNVHVCFDGKGGIREYSLCNQSGSLIRDCGMSIFIDGERLDDYCFKKVKLAGRTGTITVRSGETQIEILQFVAQSKQAVFYEIKTNKPGNYEFVLDFIHAQNEFRYATDAVDWYDDENLALYLRVRRNARFVLSYDTMTNCKWMLAEFDKFKKQVDDEIRSVKIPPSAKTEKEKAIYLSGVFSALENYRESGSFKGFVPGGRFDAPFRSYYRDSYWTVLCLYRYRPDLIRNQILTLARGVEEYGDCPSSVTVDFHPHCSYYDSPSFFIMAVYDYINRLGDFSILDETVNGKIAYLKTVYDYCLLVIDRLSEYEDKTGLIVKSGRYNRRDWTDHVNRTGYVTYVELLYARALYCASRIAGTRDEKRARNYYEMYVRTKNAINKLLWDDEKGYYINYRDKDFTEDNLSVDTVLAVLFGISDEKRTVRLLDNIASLLETRNNPKTRLGDFGVASVFPCYRGIDRCFGPSRQIYVQHNGASWPYWSALIAYAQMRNGRDYSYALTSPFDWNVNKRGNYTPVQCYSTNAPDGLPLYAASSDVAFVYDWANEDFFKENQAVWNRVTPEKKHTAAP